MSIEDLYLFILSFEPLLSLSSSSASWIYSSLITIVGDWARGERKAGLSCALGARFMLLMFARESLYYTGGYSLTSSRP